MPHPNSINPKTGKRFAWEVEQKALTADEDSRKNVAEELALLARREAAIIARDDLLKFTQFTMPDPADSNNIEKTMYEAAKFHKAVCRALEQVEKGEITQLIFCMPPRHGKTELATKRLAAWYSGRHPDHDVIVAAAGDDLAKDYGGDVRAIMTSPQYRQVFPNHKLRRGGTAKDNIQTVNGGRLVFAGRGGQINGRGAHLLLIDDLYKDHEEARSQVIRDQAWNWFTKVALYRRMGKRLTIITMTRWHSDDIIGRLTNPDESNIYYSKEEAATWKLIRLPGLAEDDDPLGRKPGEALWPEIRKDGTSFNVEYHLGNQRRDPLGFASLTQQRPTVADGTYFRRENLDPYRYRTEDLPEKLRYYAASDHAVATKQRNDPSCFGKFGVDQHDNIYVLETFWERAPSDRAVEAMLEMCKGERAPLLWFAEKGHISMSIGPFLRKRMLETGIYINVREITPKSDKAQRAQSMIARVAMGKVRFPRGMEWADRAIEEMLAFDNGTHDDFVDMLSLLGLGLGSVFGASPPPVVKKLPEFGSLAWVKLNDTWKADQERAAKVGGF
jgi:predicted phage terminase large subunit-like protein